MADRPNARAVNAIFSMLRQDVTDNEEIESRWEAAATLHFWLRHLLEKGDRSLFNTGVAEVLPIYS